jgi:hypothetical protein
MIDFNVLASRVMRYCKCSRQDALSAIAEAYIACDKTRSEAEQAQYMYVSACYTRLDHVSRSVKATREQQDMDAALSKLKLIDEDATLEDLSVAPEDLQADSEYLLDLTNRLPPVYRMAVIAVAHALLTSRIQNRQPLTVEMTRQLLKKRNIANASEMARQVYTFLTTFKGKR